MTVIKFLVFGMHANKLYLTIALIIGIGFVVFSVSRRPETAPGPLATPVATAAPSPSPANRGLIIEAQKGAIPAPPGVSTPAPVLIGVTARQWAFEPSTITVKLGQKVTLNITSTDVTHGIGIPDFGVNTNLEAGKTSAVTFTPDKTGSFTFFCSVFCGSGHRDMKGTLVVE